VIECQLRFKSPARYDELIRVELWVTWAEKIRLSFGYRILDCEESLLVEAATMHVCTSLQDKPKRLPNELVKALLPFLRSAQEGNLAVVLSEK
jgi:acyl-CoA thioester hydrolase